MMTDKPEELALIRAIQANVEDDAPRWIIADWYDENGYPERAEFIRLELELGKAEKEGTTYSDVIGYIGRYERALELRTEHGHNWYKPELLGVAQYFYTSKHRSCAGNGICQKSQLYTHRRNIGYTGDWQHNESRRAATEIEWSYHRGFINKLTISTELWATHYETILAHYPITYVYTHGRVPIYHDEVMHYWLVLLPNHDTIPCESYEKAVHRWLQYFMHGHSRLRFKHLMELTVQKSALVPDC